MGLRPITAGVDLAGFAERLAAQRRPRGRVAAVDTASLDADLGAPGITTRASSDAEANRRIAVRLDEIETGHDFVLLLANARQAFRGNPTGDCNGLLLMSLIKGRRLRRIVHQSLRETVGFSADLEALWKGCCVVATNHSQPCEQVLRHGPLLQALLASVAIPGALPPVIRDGDLLCDGGTFNNFAVEVMRGMRGHAVEDEPQVRLRDGRELPLRPAGDGDGDAVRHLFRQMPPQGVYTRSSARSAACRWRTCSASATWTSRTRWRWWLPPGRATTRRWWAMPCTWWTPAPTWPRPPSSCTRTGRARGRAAGCRASWRHTRSGAGCAVSWPRSSRATSTWFAWHAPRRARCSWKTSAACCG
jgi:hypothetical protein